MAIVLNNSHDLIEDEWKQASRMPLDRSYSLTVNPIYVNKEWTDEEKKMLRPIAETLALLDGNAFFTQKLLDNRDWYEQYLSEAATIFWENGGIGGWPGEVSWIKDLTHESEAVKEAYISWQTLKKLSQP